MGKRGGMGGMGGANMGQLMKQAQKKMEKNQQELNEKEIEVTSGGGAVKIVITGAKDIKAITIDKDVVDPDDVEMLQDLIMTAVNEALRQAKEAENELAGQLMSGLNLPPGLF